MGRGGSCPRAPEARSLARAAARAVLVARAELVLERVLVLGLVFVFELVLVHVIAPPRLTGPASSAGAGTGALRAGARPGLGARVLASLGSVGGPRLISREARRTAEGALPGWRIRSITVRQAFFFCSTPMGSPRGGSAVARAGPDRRWTSNRSACPAGIRRMATGGWLQPFFAAPREVSGRGTWCWPRARELRGVAPEASFRRVRRLLSLPAAAGRPGARPRRRRRAWGRASAAPRRRRRAGAPSGAWPGP